MSKSTSMSGDRPLAERLALEATRRRLLGAEPRHPRLGRYEVQHSLGEGGMAEVYAAYDQELRRLVALKLLRPDAHGPEPRRIIREAQAQAQLSHPNVVEVFDVGIAEREVFIAMELVHGGSLAAWLDATRRAWPEILEVFRGAAQGLLAAHRVQLVHRDFKPANVLLTADNVAKIADFGLALRASPTLSDPREAPRTDPGALAERLTKTGVAAGTPLYMAPEQHRGREVDHRADQYSFCVSLFQALVGRRPFSGKTLDDLVAEKTRGAPRPSAGERIPRFLVAALRRGMAPRPADRWPSMEALIDALQPRRRRRAFTALSVGTVALGLGWAAQSRPPPCEVPDAAAEVWSAERQQILHEAVTGSAAPHAEDGWRHIRTSLDQRVARWADNYGVACESQAPQAAAGRRCLDDDLRRLDTLVAALNEAGPAALDSVDAILAGLPSPERCLDAADGEGGPSEATRRAIDDLRTEAAAAEATGDWERVALAATEALSRARADDDRHLEAHAHHELGEAGCEQDHCLESIESLERAYFLADELGDHELAARAASALVEIRTEHDDDLTEAERWERHAQGHLEHVEPAATRGDVLLALATLQAHAADYEEAIELASQATAAFEHAYGPDHPQLAHALNDEGLYRANAGQHEVALALLRRADTLISQGLGAASPRRAYPLSNLGLVLYQMQRAEEAVVVLQEALGRIGEVDPSLRARVRSNLGVALIDLRRPDEAQQVLQLAREDLLSIDPAHPLRSSLDINIGLAQHGAGHPELARMTYERALAELLITFGDDHPTIAYARYHLGRALNALGQHAAAREKLLAAREVVRDDPRFAARVETELASAARGLMSDSAEAAGSTARPAPPR